MVITTNVMIKRMTWSASNRVLLLQAKKNRNQEHIHCAVWHDTLQKKYHFAILTHVALEALHLGVAQDFVALMETWLTSDVQDSEITPPNYVIVRKDRSTRGGGIVFLIRKEISYVTLLIS